MRTVTFWKVHLISVVSMLALTALFFSCGQSPALAPAPVAVVDPSLVTGNPYGFPVTPIPGGPGGVTPAYGNISVSLAYPSFNGTMTAPILKPSNLSSYPGGNTGIFIQAGSRVIPKANGRWGYLPSSLFSVQVVCGQYSFTSNLRGQVAGQWFDLGNGVPVVINQSGYLYVGFDSDLGRSQPCVSSGYALLLQIYPQ